MKKIRILTASLLCALAVLYIVFNINTNSLGDKKPAFHSTDFVPEIHLDGELDNISNKKSVDVNMTYTSVNKNFSCTTSIKWQGSSSLRYPKKNYNVKMYTDRTKTQRYEQKFLDWNPLSKFALKANYIDHSHARNIVSARLWTDVLKSREDFENLPEEISTSSNFGVTDGFPVKLYINNTYQGIYTLNIPKSEMTNLNPNNEKQATVCSENYLSGCFRELPKLDGSDWTLESPKILHPNIKDSWTDAINFVMTSTNEEFISNLDTYFDKQSLIDYYIFMYLICDLDGMGKNQVFTTYDGTKWYAEPYDLDSTFGLFYNGTKFVPTTYKQQEDYESGKKTGGNLLYIRLSELFNKEIRARYIQLREVLNTDYVTNRFKEYIRKIPYQLYAQESVVYPSIPNTYTDAFSQITNFYKSRYEYVDSMLTEKTPELELLEGTINADLNGKITSSPGHYVTDYINLLPMEHIGIHIDNCSFKARFYDYHKNLIYDVQSDWHNDLSTFRIPQTYTGEARYVRLEITGKDGIPITKEQIPELITINSLYKTKVQ